MGGADGSGLGQAGKVDGDLFVVQLIFHLLSLLLFGILSLHADSGRTFTEENLKGSGRNKKCVGGEGVGMLQGGGFDDNPHSHTHTPEQRGPHQERVSHSRPPRHCAESRQMRDQPCPAQPSALCPHVPFLNPWIYYFVSFVIVVWCSSVRPEASVCDLNLKPCLTIQHYH